MRALFRTPYTFTDTYKNTPEHSIGMVHLICKLRILTSNTKISYSSQSSRRYIFFFLVLMFAFNGSGENCLRTTEVQWISFYPFEPLGIKRIPIVFALHIIACGLAALWNALAFFTHLFNMLPCCQPLVLEWNDTTEKGMHKSSSNHLVYLCS